MAAPARSRKADILAAAEREFALAGLAGARIDRIAAAAGVNKQLLFHYFGSKEGLFEAALSALLAQAEPKAPNGGTPAEELRRLLAALQGAAESLPGLVGIVADSTANPEFPSHPQRALRGWLVMMHTRLADVITDGQRRGYFRDDIDPAATAQLALAASLGTGAIGERAVSVATFIADHCAWR